MNYKTINIPEFSENSAYFSNNINNFYYKKNQVPVLVEEKHKINENHFKFDDLQKHLEQLFSEDDKLILLQQVRDEIAQLECSLYLFLKDGNYLNEMLNIFDACKISYSKLLLKIFQNLIMNSSEFSTFITCNESVFLQLLNVEELFCDLFNLFSKVINEIPDFANTLHTNNLIPIVFDACSKIQEDTDSNLVQSIAILMKTIIDKNKLFSDYYDTDEARYDVSIKLSSIAHSLINYLCFIEKNESKYEISKSTLEYHSTIREPIFLLLESLCYSKLSSIDQLFDENTGIFLYNYIRKGKYMKDISEILISLAKNFTNDVYSFIDQFDIMPPLIRLGKDPRYQWEIISIFIAFAEASPIIADSIYEYEFLEEYEDSFETYDIEKRELYITLFLFICINAPQSISSKKNLSAFYDEAMDLLDSLSDKFTILFLRSIDSLSTQPTFDITFCFDCSELGEKLDDLSTNSDNEEIVALCKEILPKLP